MNGENEALLQQGIGEVRNGNKREGARLLAQVVKSEPQSEDAWFWLAAATDQPSEAAACLRRVLAINPNNTRASQALEMLGQPARSMNTSELLGSPSFNQARSLNTGELLGFAGGNSNSNTTTIAPPPPPPSSSYGNAAGAAPFSENDLLGITTPANTAPNRPSDLFGGTGTLNSPPSVPSPFGQPSWAASQESTPPRPPLPDFGNDPYTGQPNPGFSGGGVRLGQLDPELAAQQAAQAAQNTAPSYYDAGADVRAGLLDDNSRPQVIPQPIKTGRTPKIKAPKPTKIKLTSPPVRTRRRNLLPLLIILVLIVVVVVVALFLIRNANNNTTNTIIANNATPAPVDTSGTATVAITSAGAETTSVNPAVATTTQVIVATTSAATTTQAVVATTSAVTTVPATTAVLTTIAPTTIATTAVLTTAVPGTNGQTQATAAPVISIPLAIGGKPPSDVQQYVADSRALMDKLQTYEDLLINKVEIPYRRGDIPAQADLSKLFRTDVNTLEMGEFAYRLKNQFVPTGGYYLSQVSNDYADDISQAAKAWDNFFDDGKLSNLDDVSRYAEKAQKDRARWVAALGKGYPYK